MKTIVYGQEIEYDGTEEGLKNEIEKLLHKSKVDYTDKFNLNGSINQKSIGRVLGINIPLLNNINSGLILHIDDIELITNKKVEIDSISITSDDVNIESSDKEFLIQFESKDKKLVKLTFTINYDKSQSIIIEKEFFIN